MALVISITKNEVVHIGRTVMHGNHDVFPEDGNNSNDPIPEKKLFKNEGRMSMLKTLLGFDFDGEDKILCLKESKRIDFDNSANLQYAQHSVKNLSADGWTT
jgi:hypothetical protein